MTSRERMLAAIQGKKADRLPVTTHHIMDSYLKKYQNSITYDEFFNKYGFDAIRWIAPHKPNTAKGDYYDIAKNDLGLLDSQKIVNDNWRITSERIPDDRYVTVRYTIATPDGDLSCVLQYNEHTNWVIEHLLKEKSDIELFAKYAPTPLCDVEEVNREAEAFGDRGIIRSHIFPTEFFGQPGCWQDACCIAGTERMIIEAYDDPDWVHEFLQILQKRKLEYITSLKGAKYDIIELGGGDGCTSVISPSMFDEFVAPYDVKLIEAMHDAGQRVSYHLCGKKMPILADVVAMKPDAIETFTPVGMGADVDLAKAKEIVGNKCCMIGGFDQFHFFVGCTEEETRAEVRRCFEAAGQDGGYIISPSDHFFDAEDRLVYAFVDEAHKCLY